MLRYYTGIKPTGRVYDYIATKERHQMRVPDIIKDCVCFVCYRRKGGHGIAFGGTAVFLAYSEMDIHRRLGYTVTAWHVINGIIEDSSDGKVLLRVNTLDDSFDFVETDNKDWLRHPTDTSVDVAVLGATPTTHKYIVQPYDASLLLTPETAIAENIGIGDEVFITGLFRQPADKRNFPILRQGTIAMMPEALIPTKKFGSVEAFLVEVRSLGGLSGSPVFVYLSNIRRTRKAHRFEAIAYVLGIVHGHYEYDLPQPDELIEDAAQVQQINRGIALVVPADKIIETLNHPRLVEMREKNVRDNDDDDLPVEDFADDEDTPEFTEEDFEEALRKVSRPVKPKGRKGKGKKSE